MESTAQRLREVRDKLSAAAAASGRSAESVEIIAVAKTATAESLCAAWEAGQRHFGHNRLQSLAAHHALIPEANWHFIGLLQRNKAKAALEMSLLLHTIGDLRIAERCNRLSEEAGLTCCVLVQVNSTPEDGRYGCQLNRLEEFLSELSPLSNLRVDGLMTLAPNKATESTLRRVFSSVREGAQQQAANGLLPTSPQLSMGMSNDYEIAVAEGATLVRVGRAIFPAATFS
ncbi:MAG: YggS family pyridoxal phosphate-dependent enzyme [Planctomycetota bacterium]|nr:MAG: YggS family pyridoxal phosphate-dependent enzyme [Planctomycetota bacterium]